VPPLLPVMASLTTVDNSEQAEKLGDITKYWPDKWLYDTSTEELWGTVEQARFPMQYMANLFSAGDTEMIKLRIKKLMAVRIHRRWKTVGDIPEERARQVLKDVGLTPESADEIYYLTSLAKFDDRSFRGAGSASGTCHRNDGKHRRCKGKYRFWLQGRYGEEGTVK